MGVEVVSGGKISVLLSAYNGERFLPLQLLSLRGQLDPDFVVLMRDDGSTDGTRALLEKAEGDGRFWMVSVDRKARLGASGSFMTLLRITGTPYAAFCDQDDSWDPERLSRCREAMEEAEARWGRDCPILVHSDCRLVDERG